MRQTYTIQENGQVTLPREWREKYGLKKGDQVTFTETEQGLIISPRQLIALDALDRIGKALQEQGISLEDLLGSGRDIRQQIYDERYSSQAEEHD